ncbi:MAG: type II toxin-antitoxin system Phd/YefM family antitoxin [Armatimonadota bacterium]
MVRVKPTEDVRPLSEFRANTAAFVQHVQGTKRPLILTQHGRSAAVLMDVAAYEALVDAVELLRDVRTAEEQLDKGKGMAHSRARAAVLARLRR